MVTKKKKHVCSELRGGTIAAQVGLVFAGALGDTQWAVDMAPWQVGQKRDIAFGLFMQNLCRC